MAGPFESNIVRRAARDGKVVAFPSPTIYDIVRIGDYVFPGISRITSIKRERKISTEKAKKNKGARVVDSGINLARIEVETKIFEDDELEEMARIINFFETQVGLKPTDPTAKETNGFPIFHPATRERNIRYVYIEDIDGPYYIQPPGYTLYKFRFVEVVKQKTTSSKTAIEKELNLDGQQASLDVSKPLPPSQDPKQINP